MKALPALIFAMSMGCGNDGRGPVVHRDHPDAEQLIKENKEAIRLEDRDIELYAERMGLSTTTTGRGVRYKVIRDVEGAPVLPGQWAMVNYRLELLTGDTAYLTQPDAPEAFLVEMDDVESGLHEGIQLLSPGDSAILIIPSYRAHGLIGDQDRIPRRSTVVYHIGLVKVSGEAR